MIHNYRRRFPSLALRACLLAAVTWVTNLGIAFAQPPKTPAAKSSDQKLLDELEPDLLDDLPAAKQLAKGKEGAAKQNPLDEKLQDDLAAGEDLGAAPENPLENIGRQMRAASERIAQSDTSEETQATQGNVVKELEKLIEQAKKQGASGNKSASGKGTGKAGAGDGQAQPGNPQESTDRVGKANTEPTQKTEVKDLLRRIWGHLPEKQRDEMQNAFSDQFLPKYEKLIEEYFQRLAEERATGP